MMLPMWSDRPGDASRAPEEQARHQVEELWLADVLGTSSVDESARQQLLRHVDEVCRGTVKFFHSEKGWGRIESDDTPFDVWVHFSVIEGTGYRELIAGEEVEFRWAPAVQDSWRCIATWVRRTATSVR